MNTTGWAGYDAEFSEWHRARADVMRGQRGDRRFRRLADRLRLFDYEEDEAAEIRDSSPNVDFPHPARIAKEFNKPFWRLFQEIGDCTGFGLAHAMQATNLFQKHLGDEQKVQIAHPSDLYGQGRQIWRRFSGDGCTGSAVARGAAEHGFLMLGDDGVPPYSGELSRKWGGRGGDRFLARYDHLRVDRKIAHVHCRGYTQAMDMLTGGCGLAIAAHYGFDFETDGGITVGTLNKRKPWSHQWAVVFADREWVYAQNSHKDRPDWIMSHETFDQVCSIGSTWIEAVKTYDGDDGGAEDWSFA